MYSTLITEYGMMCDESRYIWIPMFNSFFMVRMVAMHRTPSLAWPSAV